MIEMNKKTRVKWKALGLDTSLKKIRLASKLKKLAEAPIMDTPRGVFLKPLAVKRLKFAPRQDRTGMEGWINDIAVEHFIQLRVRPDPVRYLLTQGVLYSEKLLERLARRKEKFHVILSFDPSDGDVVVTFYMERKGKPYVAEDLEKYRLEGIIRWKT